MYVGLGFFCYTFIPIIQSSNLRLVSVWFSSKIFFFLFWKFSSKMSVVFLHIYFLFLFASLWYILYLFVCCKLSILTISFPPMHGLPFLLSCSPFHRASYSNFKGDERVGKEEGSRGYESRPSTSNFIPNMVLVICIWTFHRLQQPAVIIGNIRSHPSTVDGREKKKSICYKSYEVLQKNLWLLSESSMHACLLEFSMT